jgi:hypothetical protein
MNLGAIAEFLLKAANIYLVYWIFTRNFSERRNERMRDVSRDSLKFMIQEMVLKPNMTLVTSFFQSQKWSLPMLKDAKKKENFSYPELEEVGEKAISEFKDEMDSLKQRIVFPLKILSPSFGDLLDIVSDTEDCFTGHVQKFLEDVEKQEVIIESDLHQVEILRERFVNCLIKGQLGCLGSAEPIQSEKRAKWWRKIID